MTAELLRVEGLRYLENGPYSFVLHTNEVLGLTGPSGVGKTQLLRALVQCLAGEGAIFYKGRPIESFAAPEWRKMVNLVPSDSVWWRERVGQHLIGADGEEVDSLLRSLGFESEVVDWEVARLSSAALDTQSALLMERLLRSYLRRTDTAIIWISHDLGQLQRVADRCLRLTRSGLETMRPQPRQEETRRQ